MIGRWVHVALLGLAACAAPYAGPLQVGLVVTQYASIDTLGVRLAIGVPVDPPVADVLATAGACERLAPVSYVAPTSSPDADDPMNAVERAVVRAGDQEVALEARGMCLYSRHGDCWFTGWEGQLEPDAVGATLGLDVVHARFTIDEPELIVIPPGPVRVVDGAIGVPGRADEVVWSEPVEGGEVTLWLSATKVPYEADTEVVTWSCTVPDTGRFAFPDEVVATLHGLEGQVVVGRDAFVEVDVAVDVVLSADAGSSDLLPITVP